MLIFDKNQMKFGNYRISFLSQT